MTKALCRLTSLSTILLARMFVPVSAEGLVTLDPYESGDGENQYFSATIPCCTYPGFGDGRNNIESVFTSSTNKFVTAREDQQTYASSSDEKLTRIDSISSIIEFMKVKIVDISSEAQLFANTYLISAL